MRILWLNWRDIKNPESGGAEVMTHETAKRLAAAGHQVTLFTSKFKRSKSQEIIDQVTIIRRGNRLTCRFWAALAYQKNFKGKIDVVVDEINTIPFFTNLYVKEKKIALIHQLAREYWWSETFFPLNFFGYILETFFLKPYRHLPTIAASISTKNDLQKIGFTKVSVFYQGLSVTPASLVPPKPKVPTILFIGRLTRPKGPQDAIIAFKTINKIIPRSKLIIVGSGKSQFADSLKTLVQKLKLESRIEFRGFISESEKIDLLKKAAIVLVPSVREGWNLVPIEANSFGAVPVGYNVQGLRDSIKNEKTGILTRTNSPQSLARVTISLLSNKKLLKKLAADGLIWSKKFSWNKTYESFSKVLETKYQNILWLSWRDIKNPDAGGAEKVSIETASRFVRDGASVTIFTSRFKGARGSETIKGVRIVRNGNRLTCRFHAFFYYLKYRGLFDLIIDEINTIPFFSIFYASSKTLTLIHQLAREFWFSQTIWPLSLIGYWLEPFALKLYQNRPTIVVSRSTQKDLQKLGFKNTKIVREGLDFKPQFASVKEDLILFIGRLIEPKGPSDAITAFRKTNDIVPSTKLVIIGRGDPGFTANLKRQTRSLGLKNKVKFTGFIPELEKMSLLRKAKVVLIPSIREGWGLVATETNALGAVPVAYNVPGLRDSIVNGQTGILTETNPQALAKSTIQILKNESERLRLAKNGYLWSQEFSWENCYKDFKRFVKDHSHQLK